MHILYPYKIRNYGFLLPRDIAIPAARYWLLLSRYVYPNRIAEE